MRVAFFGTPDFAVNSLRRLIESGREIVAVVCQPDKAGNRGKISCCAVKNYAAERGLKVFQFDSVSREGAETLRALRPDVIVTCAFGQFFKRGNSFARAFWRDKRPRFAAARLQRSFSRSERADKRRNGNRRDDYANRKENGCGRYHFK